MRFMMRTQNPGQRYFSLTNGETVSQKWNNSVIDNRDMASAILKFKDIGGNIKRVLISSVYVPCGNKIDLNNIRMATEFAKKQKISLLLGTDSNSHHNAWIDDRIDERGEELLEYLINNNLVFLNKKSKTFIRGSSSTAIDLTIATRGFSERIMNWKVEDLALGSDHIPITFEIHSIVKKREGYRNV